MTNEEVGGEGRGGRRGKRGGEAKRESQGLYFRQGRTDNMHRISGGREKVRFRPSGGGCLMGGGPISRTPLPHHIQSPHGCEKGNTESKAETNGSRT